MTCSWDCLALLCMNTCAYLENLYDKCRTCDMCYLKSWHVWRIMTCNVLACNYLNMILTSSGTCLRIPWLFRASSYVIKRIWIYLSIWADACINLGGFPVADVDLSSLFIVADYDVNLGGCLQFGRIPIGCLDRTRSQHALLILYMSYMPWKCANLFLWLMIKWLW